MRGHLTEKADVFGFGVVALEILSGRANSDSSLDDERVYLLEWVREKNSVYFFFTCLFTLVNEISPSQSELTV
jgi:hypothetical protein